MSRLSERLQLAAASATFPQDRIRSAGSEEGLLRVAMSAKCQFNAHPLCAREPKAIEHRAGRNAQVRRGGIRAASPRSFSVRARS
jgi:hypothetical protein